MAPHANADVEIEPVTDTSSVVVNDPVQTKTVHPQRMTIDHVLHHRQTGTAVPNIVAAFASPNMFKSKSALGKPKAKKSFEHRLTEESKSRNPSSLKEAMKYYRAGTISLCGGLPSR